LRQKFFLGKKGAAENRMNAEGVEIVRGCISATQLHRIALSGEDVTHAGVRGEAREDRLAVAIMPEPRNRHRELLEVPLLRLGLENDELVRFLERQPFQKEVVDQTEDGSVHSNAEREREYGKESECGRFQKLADGKAEIGHGNFRFWIFDFRLGKFIRCGARRLGSREWRGVRGSDMRAERRSRAWRKSPRAREGYSPKPRRAGR
jgi:hypothetical protein